jgi:uncharacterized membrane protein
MITQFIGRFHPLLVHLPIGFLILAFIFECLSLLEKYRKLKIAVQPSLVLGVVFGVVACVTGYVLKQEGGYDAELVGLHQNFGIATTAFTIFLYVLRKKIRQLVPDKQKRKQVRVLLFLPLIGLLAATGHLGGTLTHGESFLSLNQLSLTEPADPRNKIGMIAYVDTAVLYRDVIQPLLEARCYSCHSAAKQKGKLRLDNPEFILKGGEDGKILASELPDSSALYTCLMLPLEDKHHMPPEEKTQMSSTDIALVQAWIEDGASFSKKVTAFENPNKLIAYIKSYRTSSIHTSWIPEGEIAEADEAIVSKLKSSGAIVMAASASSHYLMINFVNVRRDIKKFLPSLIALKAQVVWMNLGYTDITDEDMLTIGALENLRVLYLNNTAITDKGIGYCKNLKQLRYINMVNTAITDKALLVLRDLNPLEKVYAYQTRLTAQGVSDFLSKSPKVIIDTGNYELHSLPGDTTVYKRKI